MWRGKWSVLVKEYVSTQNNILIQGRKILPTIYPVYKVNPSISRRCVGDILSKNKKLKNETCESVKWLKGEKLEHFENALVIWIRQVNAKSTTAGNEVIKELAKALGQQMNVINFVHKVGIYFTPKIRL
jgi:hypothetical protein